MIVDALKKQEARIDRLLQRVRGLVASETSANRQLLSNVEVTARVRADRPFEQVTATFYNGSVSPQIFNRIGVSLSSDLVYSFGGTLFTEVRPVLKTVSGWSAENRDRVLRPGDGQNVSDVRYLFDFNWNYVVGRRQARYSREVDVNSEVLAGQNRGLFLSPRTPLVVPPGEELTFSVRPTLFVLPVLAETDIVLDRTFFDVVFNLSGSREDDLL